MQCTDPNNWLGLFWILNSSPGFTWSYKHKKTLNRHSSENVHDVLASYASPTVVHESLILQMETEREQIVLQCLENSFNDESTSDLTIQVENQSIHVHKAILRIRSTYFKYMFQHNGTENNQSVIEHTEYSYIVFNAFLKYLYTGVVDLPPEKALELFKLAAVYREDDLKQRCISIIEQGISVANAAFLYSTAIEYNAKELQEFCFNFALNNMTKVVQTKDFAKLNQKEMNRFIIMAAEAGAFKESDQCEKNLRTRVLALRTGRARLTRKDIYMA